MPELIFQIFPNMLLNTSSDFISDIGVTDVGTMIDGIENKIENLLECSL